MLQLLRCAFGGGCSRRQGSLRMKRCVLNAQRVGAFLRGRERRRFCSSHAEETWPGMQQEIIEVTEIPEKGRGVRAKKAVLGGSQVARVEPLARLSSNISDDFASDPLLSAVDLSELIDICQKNQLRFPGMAILMASQALQHPDGFNDYWSRVYRLQFASLGDSLPPTYKWFARTLGTLHINVIRCSQSGCSVLLESGSMFNHSCNPNVAVEWEVGGRDNNDSSQALAAAFRSTRDISEGEELCISYAAPDMILDEKQQMLRFAYGIACGESCDCDFDSKE